MAVGYYKTFDVFRIDTNGDIIPLASEVLDVYNVTASASLGTVTTTADGMVDEGSFSADAGDIVEFTDATYSGAAFRLTLTATQAEAYTHIDNLRIGFVVENGISGTTESNEAFLHILDDDQPDLPPIYVGQVTAGSTTLVPYRRINRDQNLTCFIVSQSEKRQLTTSTPAFAESAAVVVPASSGGSGSVTSVGLSLPGIFSVSGSPVTTTGTLTGTLATQSVNTVFAGPSSGGSAAPTFRALVLADLPTMTSANLASLVTDETGTGNLVFSAAPTLTGDVKGGTFNANGSTPPATPAFFYVFASGSYGTGTAGADLSVRNSNAAQTGIYGVNATSTQVTNNAASGVLYGGKFKAEALANVATSYAFYADSTTGSGATVADAGGVLIKLNNSGTVTNFKALFLDLINGGTTPTLFGSRLRLINNAAVTSFTGVNVEIANVSTISDARGISFTGYSVGSGITNNYLIYAESGTAVGTNKWALHFLCDMPSYMVGKLGLGSGNTTPAVRLTVRDTVEQFRVEYDASNYYKTTVGSTGGVTFDAVGSGAAFTFSDAVTFSENITIADAKNVVLNTTTGTKIGTSTIQKLGFWNKTPIIQPDTSTGTSAFVANSGTAINTASTFDGYTLDQVVNALRLIGILA